MDILAGSAVATVEVPGPLNLWDAPPGYISLGSAVTFPVVTGPVPQRVPGVVKIVRPMTIPGTSRISGPWLPVPDPELEDDPFLPVIPFTPTGGIDPFGVPARLVVRDEPLAMDVEVTPALNAPGSGSYKVLPPGPEPDEQVAFVAAGQRVLTGLASSVTHDEVDQGEEPGQLVSVTVDGLLVEMDQVLVLPDYGSREVEYLGKPLQDSRSMDWHMDQLGSGSSTVIPPFTMIRSRELNMIDSALGGLFPLPDVWPDPGARWMWVAPPQNPAPRGWCYFRANTLVHAEAGIHQVWAVAHDYAEVWVDGTQVLTCDTPGVAQHVEIEFSRRPHLATIRAYNDRGRAAVAFTMKRVDPTGFFHEPHLRSESNWRCLAYPQRSLRLSPGAVMMQLRYEARRRVAMGGNWEFSFDQFTDSAGRPWPSGDVINLKVGDTMLNVLDQLAETRVDYASAPAQRRLDMWVKDAGTGRSVDLAWTEGVDLESRGRKRTTR